ncbi:MAG TPA: MBL fold metallo-hydrolase [Steroidobacteraceae bacterium]|nr:MBL fold metallo-hydrolase [Steroidobacteraceae bacterium]
MSVGIKRLFLSSGLLLAALLLFFIGLFAVTGHSAFGSEPTGDRLLRAQQSPEWRDGHFQNAQPIWIDTRQAFLHFAFGTASKDVEPHSLIPAVHTEAAALAVPPSSGLRVTWFGHSASLVEIDGSRILIDPFWSERASPVAWAGPKRWYAPPIALDDLPAIDAVLISHDHYDHLDRGAIVAMKPWKTMFIVPLGVGAHLSRWGIPQERIIELDWWQETHVGNLNIVATPSRHSSGRLSPNSDKTLWAGYALVGPEHRAWYSGDTSFQSVFAVIGERLGPFDVTLIESGQYDATWPDNHLGPEQAVEAHRQVRGKTMIPVHWALLKLATHGWTEPAERVLAAAQCRGVEVLVPRPGESVEPTLHPLIPRWWPPLPWRSAAESPIVSTQDGVPSERHKIAPCPG